VVGQQAVAVQPGRVALARQAQGAKEGPVVVVGEEDGGAVVAPVEGVVDQAVGDGTRLAPDSRILTRPPGPVKETMH
jgi:hypothetical protein